MTAKLFSVRLLACIPLVWAHTAFGEDHEREFKTPATRFEEREPEKDSPPRIYELYNEKLAISMVRNKYVYYLRLTDQKGRFPFKRGEIEIVDPRNRQIIDKQKQDEFIKELIAAGKQDPEIQKYLEELKIVKGQPECVVKVTSPKEGEKKEGKFDMSVAFEKGNPEKCSATVHPENSRSIGFCYERWIMNQVSRLSCGSLLSGEKAEIQVTCRMPKSKEKCTTSIHVQGK